MGRKGEFEWNESRTEQNRTAEQSWVKWHWRGIEPMCAGTILSRHCCGQSINRTMTTAGLHGTQLILKPSMSAFVFRICLFSTMGECIGDLLKRFGALELYLRTWVPALVNPKKTNIFWLKTSEWRRKFLGFEDFKEWTLSEWKPYLHMWAMFGSVVERLPDIMSEADFGGAILPETPSQPRQHTLVGMVFLAAEHVNLAADIVHVDIDNGRRMMAAGRGQPATSNIRVTRKAVSQIAVAEVGHRARAGKGRTFAAHTPWHELIRLRCAIEMSKVLPGMETKSINQSMHHSIDQSINQSMMRTWGTAWRICPWCSYHGWSASSAATVSSTFRRSNREFRANNYGHDARWSPRSPTWRDRTGRDWWLERWTVFSSPFYGSSTVSPKAWWLSLTHKTQNIIKKHFEKKKFWNFFFEIFWKIEKNWKKINYNDEFFFSIFLMFFFIFWNIFDWMYFRYIFSLFSMDFRAKKNSLLKIYPVQKRWRE